MEKIPWYKKCNPLWWFGNVHDPEPPAWYHADKPHWQRMLYWYLRNPLHNFQHYVIGFRDKEFTTVYIPSKEKWHDKWVLDGSRGAMIHTLTKSGKKYRFLCDRNYKLFGRVWEWYFGWDQRGAFGIAFRPAHAWNAGDNPALGAA